MATVDVTCLPAQTRLLQSRKPHRLFAAGVGSGKTEGGARFAFHRLLNEPRAKGFIGAQTHDQLVTVTLPPLVVLLEQAGLQYRWNKAPPQSWGPSRFVEHHGILSVRVPGALAPAQAHGVSVKNFNAHRGKSFGWYWLDEARDMAREAYDVVLSRLRGQPIGTAYGGVLTTTPDGFGWLHERFIEDPVPGSEVIRSATADNPYLPTSFLETLRSQYTDRFFRQECLGEFLNLTSGQVFYAFDRSRHLAAAEIDPRQPLWYSQDFNVSPLCSVWGQERGKRWAIGGEVHLEGSGRTADAAAEWCRRLADHQCKRVTVYGDQSGANRDTRGIETDYDQIRRVMSDHGWRVEIKHNRKNPPIVESVECVNAQLEHAQVTIDRSCTYLCRDLEQVSWAPGTRVIDKSDDKLTHLSDALRYYVAKRWPLPHRKAKGSMILN